MNKIMEEKYLGFSTDEELMEKIEKVCAPKKVPGLHNEPVRATGTTFWDFLSSDDSDDIYLANVMNALKEV